MDATFAQFADLLEQRFATSVPTTEDSVRYTFFAALLNSGVKPENVVLEYPHPAIPGAEVDTWLNASAKPVAFEFKYHRNPPGGRNQAKTMKAGDVFCDLGRLRRLHKTTSATCYFVYVTTRDMAVYFRNPNNGCADLFAVSPGSSISLETAWFASRPATFRRAVGEPFDARIVGAFSRDLDSEHCIRIVGVEAV